MKYTTFLAMIAMAYSCNPSLTIETAGHLPALADTADYVLLPRTDRMRIAGAPFAAISYQETGSSIPWSNDRIADWIHATAMQNGANLVKITYCAPRRMKLLTRVDAELYHVMDLKHYERKISWSSTRKLTYSDFKSPKGGTAR